MKDVKPGARFAPAERASDEAIQSQRRLLLETPLLDEFCNSVSEMVIVLNNERQIVFCNRNFTDLLDTDDPSAVFGLRPGEALGCLHANESELGCGTTEFCRMCGAANAVLQSQRLGTQEVKECRILRNADGEAFNLLVRATPLVLRGVRFTVFSAVDISHEKRRQSLERIFFHDVMNIAASLRMLIELTRSEGFTLRREVSDALYNGVSKLIEEIDSQKDLAAAERNELHVKSSPLSSKLLIDDLAALYKQYADSREVNLTIHPRSQNVIFRSDRTILSRVLENMIKNAVEACRPGDTVTLRSRKQAGRIRFTVHNPGFISGEVRLRLFQRSFSTKDKTRGLGTYSMKLLSERYLEGEVTFATSRTQGTTFTASYPLKS